MMDGDYIGGADVDDKDGRAQLVTLYTRVLLALAQNPRVSQEMLARRLDVTMRTAQRHLTELEEEGFVLVDRESKPFRYSINWTKPLPHISWLRLIVFHPDVMPALKGLSDLAAGVYDQAVKEGSDPADVLRAMLSSAERPVGAT